MYFLPFPDFFFYLSSWHAIFLSGMLDNLLLFRRIGMRGSGRNGFHEVFANGEFDHRLSLLQVD